MKIDTLENNGHQWDLLNSQIEDKNKASIVFVFGDSDVFCSENAFNSIAKFYPGAHIVGASTSGNVLGSEISDKPIIATAVQFEKGSVSVSFIDFQQGDDLETLSADLIGKLPRNGIKHIFILSDGLNINGSELVRGINKACGNIAVSGGLAGDGDRFLQTCIMADEPAKPNRVVAIGFYGDNLSVTTGCKAGWTGFGADRVITRSAGNVLFELDGRPALDLYKEYLGEFAEDLPHSGLRFPLSIRATEGDKEVIRTLLAINEQDRSITFAGDIPQGYIARLMKPDLDILIEGASEAAMDIDKVTGERALGLIVSCVGRRVVMSQMVEEELEAVEDVLGSNVQLTGFYSYGEIAPFHDELLHCQLHNQTMTLTAIYEK